MPGGDVAVVVDDDVGVGVGATTVAGGGVAVAIGVVDGVGLIVGGDVDVRVVWDG